MEKNSSFIKLFKPQYLLLDQDFPNQEAVFEAVDRLCYREKVSLKPNLVKTGLQRREQEATTGFGEGIAIPHCSLPSLQKSAVILIRLKTPVA